MFRVLDLYKKISISRNSEVVKFSALVLWNLNFKMVETSFCARYNKNIGAIFSVSPNYKTYHWFKLKFQHWPNKTHPIKEGERMKKFPEKHDARESDYDNKWQNKQDRNRDTSASLDKDDKPTMNHCLVTAFDMAHISLQNVIYMISKV